MSRALLVLAIVLAAAGVARAADPSCPTVPGFELLPQHSSWGNTGAQQSVLCNYGGTGRPNEPTAGLAITVDYACPSETNDAWHSKTDRVKDNEVQRTVDMVVRREFRQASGYAGDFEANEKMFLRIDDRTLATLYLMANTSAGGQLTHDIRDLEQWAIAQAQAHAPSNLPCDPVAPIDAGRIDATPLDAGVDAGPPGSCEPRGRVLDRLGQPVRGIQVELVAGTTSRDQATGDDGSFRFPALVAASGFDPATDTIALTVWTRELAPGRFDINHETSVAGWGSKAFTIAADETCERVFDARAGSAPDRWADLLEIYQRIRTAWTLADQLRIPMDYGLPLQVFAWCTLPKFCDRDRDRDGLRDPMFAFHVASRTDGYYRDRPLIGLGAWSSSLDDDNWPDNREYHEFGHAVLADAFDNMTPGDPNSNNHDGYYLNPASTDSWVEGFAEFFSMMVAKHIDQRWRPELYKVMGSYINLELDHRPWDNRAKEELAVAALLLDFEDGAGDYEAGRPARTLKVKAWTVIEDRAYGKLVVGSVVNTTPDDVSEATVAVAVFHDEAGKVIHVSAAQTVPPDLATTQKGTFAIPVPRDLRYHEVVVVAIEGRPGDVGNDDDPMDLELAELWGAIYAFKGPAGYHVLNVADLYQALKVFAGRDADKDGRDDVDQVFLAHGFYGDVDGNRSWSTDETIGLTSHPARGDSRAMIPRNDLEPPDTLRLAVNGAAGAWVTVTVELAGAASGHGWSYVAQVGADGTIVLPAVPSHVDATISVVAQAVGKLPQVAARFDAATLASATTPPAPVALTWVAGSVTVPAPGGGGPSSTALLIAGGAVAAVSALALVILVATRRRR